MIAIGAFLTFTMSQTGMVHHWQRELRKAQDARERHRHRSRLAINAVGAFTTALAFAIIISAKFTEGAWITILVIPCVIVLLKAIKRLTLLRGDRVLVIGQGPIGLMFTRLLARRGINVLAGDLLPSRLKLAREFGARWAMRGDDRNFVARVNMLTRGAGLDAAIVAVPSNAAVCQAQELVRGGVLVRRCGAAGPENLDDKDVVDPVGLVVEQHHEIIGVLRRNAEGLRPRQLGNAECHATILLQFGYGLSYAVRATTLDIG